MIDMILGFGVFLLIALGFYGLTSWLKGAMRPDGYEKLAGFRTIRCPACATFDPPVFVSYVECEFGRDYMTEDRSSAECVECHHRSTFGAFREAYRKANRIYT